jgi:hypothetical protein
VATRVLRAAVVVLSPEFVRKAHPMRELGIFLERKARDPSSIVIIPVLLGLTVEQCRDMEALYSQPWPEGIQAPEKAESLKEWAAAVRQLLEMPMIRSEEVRVACVVPVATKWCAV